MKQRMFNLFKSSQGWTFTLWNDGIILGRTKDLVKPQFWWTKWFSVSMFGWTLRLCRLIDPQVRRWSVSAWVELDQAVLRVARYRLQAWADLAAASPFGGFSFRSTANDELEFELGAGD